MRRGLVFGLSPTSLWRKMSDNDSTIQAVERVIAWRQQLDLDMKAWYVRNGRAIQEPLFPPDEDVSCRFGCGTDLKTSDGVELKLLLTDIDILIDAAKKLCDG